MKALVYNGVGKLALEDKAKPTIQKPTDAIVKLDYTTICGTDLHILNGDAPEVKPGTIIGHEGVGTVHETGAGISTFKKGDQVLISCISSCGKCECCRKGMYSHCVTGGWVLGHTTDGTQAEFVRIPHADISLYKVAEGVDPKALVMLSDVFPTGFECGVLNGKVQPGGTVAIIGAGPIGLAALLTAQLYSPAWVLMVDPDRNRLEIARQFGAQHVTEPGPAVEIVGKLTGGKGCDTVIECVGLRTAFEQCQELVAPGGVIANVGVHGMSAPFHLEKLWAANISRSFLILLSR
jgi:alcohol dehydrogenase